MNEQTWHFDPAHSVISFHVEHMMLSKVCGVFGEWDGSIELDANGGLSGLVFAEIDVTSLTTNNADRDRHLLSEEFFDAEQHPKMRFSAHEVRPLDDTRFEVDGHLTIRGLTRRVTLLAHKMGAATDPWGFSRVAFGAELSISRSDYGLTWNRALETGGVLVGDRVDIKIEVQVVSEQAQLRASA